MTLPIANTFQTVIERPVDATRPSTPFGIAVPAATAVNVYGDYTEIVAAVDWGLASDAYGFEIVFVDENATTTERNAFVTIGVDPEGGVDYTPIVEHVAATQAGSLSGLGGLPYYFPVHVPAGSSIAVKIQTGDADLASLGIYIRLFCDPTHPYLLRTGTFVRTYGANLGTTLGTPVAAGAADDGAWTQIDQIDDDVWFFNVGWMRNDPAVNPNMILVDVGIGDDSAPDRVAVHNARIVSFATEALSTPLNGEHCPAEVGEYIYVRAQHAQGTEIDDSAIVYAVGGRYMPPGVHAVAGVVTVGGTAVANGKTVEIFAVDADDVAELVGTALTAGGTGAFSLDVPDNTRSYFASYEDGATLGRSASGVAGADTFDVEIAAAGGDVDPPTIAIVSPTPGVAPGDPGGFPADFATARETEIVVEITDAAPLAYACVVATFAAGSTGAYEVVVYRRGAFRSGFAARSWEEAIAGGVRLHCLPDGSWPVGSAAELADVTFEIDALDSAGNLAA